MHIGIDWTNTGKNTTTIAKRITESGHLGHKPTRPNYSGHLGQNTFGHLGQILKHIYIMTADFSDGMLPFREID